MQEEYSTFNDTYQVIRHLGDGNSSKVYLCQEIANPQNQVALKLFRNEFFIKEADAMKMIENEIAVLRALNHNNINKLIGYGTAGKMTKVNGQEINYLVYMVLEYTPKIFYDLCDSNGPLGEDLGRMFLRQILDALQYMQRRGVTHRDLKLENILVDQNLTLKIADFGLAAYKNIDTLNEYRGTKTYMAPEIRERKVYSGKQADIFSVGVILWIVINGNFPFVQAKTDDFYYRLMVDGQLDRYWAAVGGKHLSKELKDLFAKMVHYNPNERPTIDEILQHPWMQGTEHNDEQIRQNMIQGMIWEDHDNQ